MGLSWRLAMVTVLKRREKGQSIDSEMKKNNAVLQTNDTRAERPAGLGTGHINPTIHGVEPSNPLLVVPVVWGRW